MTPTGPLRGRGVVRIDLVVLVVRIRDEQEERPPGGVFLLGVCPGLEGVEEPLLGQGRPGRVSIA